VIPSFSRPRIIDRVLPRRRLRSHQKAFTILEVVMATFVMGFGIATAIISMQWGFRHLELARGSTIASQIIQSHIEQLRMMNFATIAALPASYVVDGATNFTTNPNLQGKYTLTRTRTPESGARAAEVMTINVSVSWRSYDGRNHTRSFTCLFAKNGLYDYYYTLAHS
jgi:Tfp pilus assembly protein PilV